MCEKQLNDMLHFLNQSINNTIKVFNHRWNKMMSSSKLDLLRKIELWHRRRRLVVKSVTHQLCFG